LALPSDMPTDPYQQVWKEMPASQVIGSAGAAPGQFNSPRGLAVAPDGNVYVVDSGNARVDSFDSTGKFIRSFGSSGTATGEFQEPWGIAIARTGDVYVADTWNHRVQWFDSNGSFKGMWGYFADTQGDSQASPGAFWGPRSIAIDREGFVYVTDTGNKRVQKFTPEGKFIAAFGSSGSGPGQFNEPVGIAVDPQGNFYVADTWNQRIEVFNSKFEYTADWKLTAWQGQSLSNKPYLTADDKYVYAVDPEGYRVLVFDKQGVAKFSFGRYGDDAAGMNLPAAMALDAQGRLWLSDAQNNRLLRFDNPRP
jgi:DNA-binding beta-propeller fold protein YncE